MPVKHVFTEAEIAQKKDEFFHRQVEISKVEEERDEMKKAFKSQLDPLKDAQKRTFIDIRLGFREEMQEVYLVPDHEQDIMEFRTESGELVGSRKLRPDERQTNVLRQINH
jgi:hypothetical protein